MTRPGISLTIIFQAAVLLLVASCSCSNDDDMEALSRKAALSSMLRLREVRPNPYDEAPDTMPDGGHRMHINYLGATLGQVFNDSNHVQLAAARALGIDPIEDSSEIWHLRRPVVEIKSDSLIYVDNLTHSMPYLVPEAARLLREIAVTFHDSLVARGGGDYRLKVTSVLRTAQTVKSLRRRNRNAVSQSAHLYGTTFDISYAKFICDNDAMPRTQEDLKNLLGEILHKFRNEGLCYVKYERSQACYHITAR